MEKLGYKVDKLEIEAIEMDDTGVILNSRIIQVEYRRDDVIKMIDYYIKNKNR